MFSGVFPPVSKGFKPPVGSGASSSQPGAQLLALTRSLYGRSMQNHPTNLPFGMKKIQALDGFYGDGVGSLGLPHYICPKNSKERYGIRISV